MAFLRTGAVLAAAGLAAVGVSACDSDSSARCLTVPDAAVEQIERGAPGGTLDVTKSAAVRNDVAGTVLVELRVQGSGGERTGAWSLSNLEAPGPVFSVDEVAAGLTHWPMLPYATGAELHADLDKCLG
ncbi:hypothetical protein G4X40_10690 [Rhodococcus sp. D2-41]|uniref:Lipoprotein n=1 Tax=Speluncibacter jeojiensis TaxID=2710754 RepID=A0A9X4LXY0_9ACTN|nr:hypothetical protein [Rhodococcus sp. D2-41]MDG3010616.1 hypothetical protein [Rhodococcus sp. D2-41]MDG3014364.1 hypothetical protein [Corynebacteriales bacterium D3-21]